MSYLKKFFDKAGQVGDDPLIRSPLWDETYKAFFSRREAEGPAEDMLSLFRKKLKEGSMGQHATVLTIDEKIKIMGLALVEGRKIHGGSAGKVYKELYKKMIDLIVNYDPDNKPGPQATKSNEPTPRS